MGKRGASILLVLALQALLLVAGTSAARAAGDLDVLRLPSDITDLASKVARIGDEEERPWKCCDLQICTRSWPPICWCRDEVEQCDNGCKDCQEVENDKYPPRYICNDMYRGDAAPSCTKEEQWHKILAHGIVAAHSSVGPAKTTTTTVAPVREDDEAAKNKQSISVAGGEQERPWQCCDMQLCTRSQPPVCSCHDRVTKCDNACKKCEMAEIFIYPPRYVCKDTYRGEPAPMCTEELVGRNNKN